MNGGGRARERERKGLCLQFVLDNGWLSASYYLYIGKRAVLHGVFPDFNLSRVATAVRQQRSVGQSLEIVGLISDAAPRGSPKALAPNFRSIGSSKKKWHL